MADGIISTENRKGEAPVVPTAPVSESAPPSLGTPDGVNIVTSPNSPLKKGWSYLTEAAKILVIAVFIIYSMGFVIWHSYLGQYGITPHGLLRTEFLSASLCYLMLMIGFAIPGALLLDNSPTASVKSTQALDALFLIWGVALMRLNSVFFPNSFDSRAGLFIIEWFGLAAIHFLVIHGLKRRLNPTFLKIARSRYWYTVYVFGMFAMPLVFNENTNLLFLISTMYVIPFSKYAYSKPLATLWADSPLAVRALTIFAIFLFFVGHLHTFAVSQFDKIPKGVGGGKPERAYLKFKSPDKTTADFFGIEEKNSMYGPVNILLHSDSEIIFVPGDIAKEPTARLVRADQLAGIRYDKANK
jgi:hypothetical protein